MFGPLLVKQVRITFTDNLICYLQSEWLEGNQLMRQQIFVLPKVEQAPGLSSVGVEASPDAKGLIMDMLVWNPDKRKTAEQVLYTSI